MAHPALIALHKDRMPDSERGRATVSFYLAFDMGIGMEKCLLGPVPASFGLTAVYLLAPGNETILDQKGKPTQSPTMRRVAQIFEGLDILTLRLHGQIVHQRIINLMPTRHSSFASWDQPPKTAIWSNLAAEYGI